MAAGGKREVLVAYLSHDIVALGLLGMVVLLSVPLIFMIGWRITRPPFRISSFRWLYLAWVCVLAATLVWNVNRTVRFSVNQAGADNFVRLVFLALGLLLILAIGSSYRFAFFSESAMGPLAIFTLFSLWGLTSTSWSVFPVGSLYKSLEYFTQLMLLALTASLINQAVRDPRRRSFALKGVFDFTWLLVFLLIASVYMGVVVLPQYGIIHGIRNTSGVLGFSIQGALPAIAANAVGQLGAILGVVSVVRLLLKSGSKVFYGTLLAISLVTMVLTQSRSPILAFAVAVVAVLLASRRFKLLAVCGVLGVAVLLTQYGQLVYEFMRRGQSENSLMTLTGRVDYWKASLAAVRERLLGGYGAYDGGRYVLSSSLGDTGTATVHSLWVEVLLDTGVVGVILILAGIVATWLWLFRLRPYAMKTPINRLLWFECLGVLSIQCVRSIFAVDLVWDWNVLFFGVILVFISVIRRQIAETRYRRAPAQPPLTVQEPRSGVRN